MIQVRAFHQLWLLPDIGAPAMSNDHPLMGASIDVLRLARYIPTAASTATATIPLPARIDPDISYETLF